MKTVIEAEKNYFFLSPLIALKAKQIQIKWTNKHIKLIAFPVAGTETSNNTFKLYKYAYAVNTSMPRKKENLRWLDWIF